MALDVITAILVIAGALFAVIGGVGLLRLPDFFTRIHGAGITDTLGAGLILTGLMFQAGVSLILVKLILILLFLWLTSPTATHALARAALESGLEPRLSDEEEVTPSNP
jgi:multicomponent Na+:H+ antiporter subunit G